MANLYEVTFFKKWSQEIEVIQNIMADSEDQAAELLIELDNDLEVSIGLDDLEYSVKVL